MESKTFTQTTTVAPAGQWSNSVWDCFKPFDMCCMAYWCPCVLFGKTHERMEDPSLSNYQTVNPWCMGHCALSLVAGIQFLLPMFDRATMRAKYNLPGSGVSDCLLSCCCHCCALMQHEKEMIARTQVVQHDGYQREAPMTYPQ